MNPCLFDSFRGDKVSIFWISVENLPFFVNQEKIFVQYQKSPDETLKFLLKLRFFKKPQLFYNKITPIR